MNDPNPPQDASILPIKPRSGEFEEAEKILRQVLEQISQEAKSKGSFYGLLSPEQRDIVDRLVEDNYPHYKNQFEGNIGTFREAMAKNYIAKTRVFVPLVVSAGYNLHVPVSDSLDRSVLNSSEVAALTANASYVLIGNGSFRSSGTSLKYHRLPLREGDRVTDVDQETGGKLNRVPNLKDRMYLQTHSGELRTSRITHLFVRTPFNQASTIHDVNQTIYHTFDGINNQTLSGRFK